VKVDSFPNLEFKFVEIENTPFSLLRHVGKPVGQLTYKLELLLEIGKKPLWWKTMLEETNAVVKMKEKSIIRKNRNYNFAGQGQNPSLVEKHSLIVAVFWRYLIVAVFWRYLIVAVFWIYLIVAVFWRYLIVAVFWRYLTVVVFWRHFTVAVFCIYLIVAVF